MGIHSDAYREIERLIVNYESRQQSGKFGSHPMGDKNLAIKVDKLYTIPAYVMIFQLSPESTSEHRKSIYQSTG